MYSRTLWVEGHANAAGIIIEKLLPKIKIGANFAPVCFVEITGIPQCDRRMDRHDHSIVVLSRANAR